MGRVSRGADCRKARAGAALLAMAAGCAAPTAASKPVVEFPQPSALAAIEARPAPEPEVTEADLPEDGWSVDGNQSSSTFDEPWTPQGAWDEAFASAVAEDGRALRLTRAMSCVAREVGRFSLKGQPHLPEVLQGFVVAACGSTASTVGMAWLQGAVPAKVGDETLLGRWRDQLRIDLLAKIPPSAAEAGFAFLREQGKVLVYVAFAERRVDFKPFSLVPDAAGDVTIEGKIREPVGYVSGYVNRGSLGVGTCFVDPSVARPRFRFVCRLDPGDETAWIQLLYAPPRRVLASPFAQILARRTTARPLTLEGPRATPDRPIAHTQEFSTVVLDRLNRTRRDAGLTPVRLAAAQSLASTQVARHYFASALGKTGDDVAETIALGLLAGWRVTGGMIRNANFVSCLVPHTRDAHRWLDTALRLPVGRATLLDPAIEEVAFGPTLQSDPDALGAVVTGYRFHHGSDHRADVITLLERVVRARKNMSLPPPARLGDMDEAMRDELERVRRGEQQPLDALDAMLHQAVYRFGANMRGFVLEATSLDQLEIPDAVLRQKALYLDIGVTHHQPPGAAWGQFVILVVFADDSGPSVLARR